MYLVPRAWYCSGFGIRDSNPGPRPPAPGPWVWPHSPLSQRQAPSLQPCPTRPDRELASDDRFDAGGGRRLMKTGRTVHPVSIEQRERRVAQLCGTLDHPLGQGRPVEEGKRRRGVELDIHLGIRGSGFGIRQFLVHDPLHEPATLTTISIDPVHATVGQRDLPFVTIPRGRVGQVGALGASQD